MKVKEYDAMKELGLPNPKPPKKSSDRATKPPNDVIYDVQPLKWKKKYPSLYQVFNEYAKKKR